MLMYYKKGSKIQKKKVIKNFFDYKKSCSTVDYSLIIRITKLMLINYKKWSKFKKKLLNNFFA